MEQFSNAERMEALAQTAKYIKRYRGKIVVVKYGGGAMVSEELQSEVMEDIACLHLFGIKTVLVHGGGPEINDMMKRLGKEPQFIDGLRVTDKETVDIVGMVLSGKVNKKLVGLLNRECVSAVGISGTDGMLIEASVKDERLGYVGKIENINPGIIYDLLDRGYIPVISTVGGDRDGNIYNVNGDTAAARIAGALRAEHLIMMTDVPGILRDKNDTSTLIRELTVAEAQELFREGVISGGMIPKLECCIEAVGRGVKNVVIMDGREKHSVISELLADAKLGTLIKA